jgi:ATP-dependent DNA helicase RecG
LTNEELLEKLALIQQMKCETQTLELKSSEHGCPKHLYDSLSSFSNQDDGGIIVFGIDEKQDYREVGVYDAQDLQKKINEQCLQMEPVVRPLLTVALKDEKSFVAAEIPGVDLADRPCYYRGKGRLKGSYRRIGDSDEPMTEYEIYSYEAYRKKYQDDVRVVERASFASLDQEMLGKYVQRIKGGKPNLSLLPDEAIYDLMSIRKDGKATLSAVMVFSLYPQAYFPQLCITAVVVPGNEIGAVGELGERFLDNQRIEGNIADMLHGAIAFVRKNMRTKTIINPDNGKREDHTDYPLTAVREAVLNALVHRDYSIHTEGMPIQLILFEDRLEIRSPGGIYGRLTVDQLGKMQPDTRNPVLVSELETLDITENRYSGIPTIRMAMDQYHLPAPEFLDERGSFIVKLCRGVADPKVSELQGKDTHGLLSFCKTPRSRKELADYLGISSVSYAVQTYVQPMVAAGQLKLTLPAKPRSPKQRYYSG